MSHFILSYLVDEFGDYTEGNNSIDSIGFSSGNCLLCWFFYETFDAHDCHNGTNGTGTEIVYTNDNLHLCRERLMYYLDEDPDVIERHVSSYIYTRGLFEVLDAVVEELIEDEEDDLIESKYQRKYECNEKEIGFTVGYILKFLDTLIVADSDYIKLKFT